MMENSEISHDCFELFKITSPLPQLLGVVMFGPGLAWKPGLWPGLGGLGLSKTSGQALMQGLGLASAWPGLSPGLVALFFQKCSWHNKDEIQVYTSMK